MASAASLTHSRFVGGKLAFGWLHYDVSSGISVDEFTSASRPSQIHSSQAIQWITVANPYKVGNESEADREGLLEAWMELQSSGEVINSAKVSALAAQYSYTVGKWMLFPSPAKVDDLWCKVAKATHEGNLGISAKVSPDNGDGKHHLICVYTQDYLDQSDVNAVLERLRGLGINGTINYKPDVYTTLGIYAKNPWNIKASVYTSKQ
ncbi:UPF0696 protein C11orf68-like [Ptychodera flava]|uniref:UPF0696 protein C11orf68-like n=1 Tax=Ptychodera flava TaxID=63121 RepID=UPI00396A8744